MKMQIRNMQGGDASYPSESQHQRSSSLIQAAAAAAAAKDEELNNDDSSSFDDGRAEHLRKMQEEA